MYRLLLAVMRKHNVGELASRFKLKPHTVTVYKNRLARQGFNVYRAKKYSRKG